MTDHKTPVDRALELFVYAPLGFALEARSLVPKMVERGRQQMTGQVTMAKMMGQFAVQQGQSEATKVVGRAQASATTALEDLGLVGGSRSPSTPTTSTPTTAEPAAAVPAVAPAPEPVPTTPPAPDPAPPPGTAAADVATLAVPDYDSLAASQVVPRLAGLSNGELEAVRAYEAAKRGRKTILNRISQLQQS